MNQTITPSISTTGAKVSAEAPLQFLAFRLGKEHFAVEILRVLEIRELSPITPIPNSASYVKGVMNLRGTVVPVMDLRMRFGIGEATYDDFTVIIVVLCGSRLIGLVVDAMSDVLEVHPKDIDPATDLSMEMDVANLAGIIRNRDEIILALNLDNLLSIDVTAES